MCKAVEDIYMLQFVVFHSLARASFVIIKQCHL